MNMFQLGKNRRIELRTKEKIEIYKQAYINFRKFYNENKNVLDLYINVLFFFLNNFRFNNKVISICLWNWIVFLTNEEYIKNGCNFFNKDTCMYRQIRFQNA